MPYVSVIIPVYNGEADLPELIECLRSQTYPAERVEYLLVDNNSGDRSFEMINAASTTESGKILIHPLQENQVQSSYAARNRGIRASQGEILVFTDADCRPEPQWLAELIQPFDHSNIGLVAGEILALPGNNWLERYADSQETLSQKHTLANQFCPYGQTANLAIRRTAFEQVGLFRPHLTTGGDADICWRIQQKTADQLHFAEKAIVKHRHRSTLDELQSQWYRYGKSNRYLHQLHGVPLMKKLNQRDYLRRWGRWILKELPTNSVQVIMGKANVVDLLNTPINLFTISAREKGQKESRLSDSAREIEWL
jgi:cellulose synthase/poly-beta-1,6-N-acetylglucosamine synthase-like glycosyltransferase